MTLIRARMIEQGEDFHIAVFPGAFSLHCGPKLEEADLQGQFFWGHTQTRAHALEAGAFVLSACGYITKDDIPADFPLRDTVNVDYAQGGSQIVAPLGIPLVPPTAGDTILYAECRADMIKVWKAIIDTVGHYARPDIVRLQYTGASAQTAELANAALEKAPRDRLDEIAEQHGVSRQSVETALEDLTRRSA
jgi:predicted amidohydrolase